MSEDQDNNKDPQDNNNNQQKGKPVKPLTRDEIDKKLKNKMQNVKNKKFEDAYSVLFDKQAAAQSVLDAVTAEIEQLVEKYEKDIL